MEKRRQIVFLEPWPTVMTYKISKLFKKKGYEVISVRILETNKTSEKFYQQAFNKVISFNLTFFKLRLKNTLKILKNLLKKIKIIIKAMREIFQLRPLVIIARATPNWPCALTKIFFKRYPLIYFPYDTRCIGVESKDTDRKMNEIPGFEFIAERFCFENSDGIMYKGDPQELELVKNSVLGKNIKIVPLQINFLPYCSKEFIVPINKNKLSKKDGEIHTVYIGSTGSVSFSSDNGIIKYFEKLTQEGIHVHLYMASNTISNGSVMSSSSQNLLKSRYFHFHLPLGPKEIIKEISKYDFGLYMRAYENSDIQLGLGNKVASYLEAGIPCLYDSGLPTIMSLIKKYKLDINLGKRDEIKDLKRRIKKLDYKKIEKNILKARKDFLMEKQFPKLEKFIEEIIKKKSQ